MRPIVLLAFALLFSPGPGFAQEQEKPGPVDVGRVLRESKEFKKGLQKFKITFEPGLVRAMGVIVYRGGGPCEYLINVFPTKAHETIVELDLGPQTGEGKRRREYVRGLATALNNALIAAGFRKGRPFDWDRKTGEVFPPTGETVRIYAEWKDAKGTLHRARMADWLWNYKTLDVMQPGKYVYTGSLMIDEGPPHHKKWFGAEVDGMLVATLSTSTVLIDDVEEGAMENGTYEALSQRIPEIGTRVIVSFSKKPLEITEKYPPLKLSKEILEERAKRKAAKAKAASGKKPAEGK